MAFSTWRGMVGCIKPSMRPGSLEELIRILPLGIGVVPLFLDIRKGSMDEFEQGVGIYEPLLDKLADLKVDLLHPEGAPPFMVLGHKGETETIKRWEKTYKIPVFTSGTNHTRALRALGIKRFVGASYLGGRISSIFSRYFTDAGFDVLEMGGIDVHFDDVNKLSPETVYAYVKNLFLKHRKQAQGIYLLGSGWRVLEMVDLLEQDLGVPVVHPIPARCWEIQRRLSIRQPVPGYGRLLAEMLPG